MYEVFARLELRYIMQVSMISKFHDVASHTFNVVKLLLW